MDFADYSNPIFDEIQEINTFLGFSESVYKEMLSTSASDGKHLTENDTIKITWKYHPDRGMEINYIIKQMNNSIIII